MCMGSDASQSPKRFWGYLGVVDSHCKLRMWPNVLHPMITTTLLKKTCHLKSRCVPNVKKTPLSQNYSISLHTPKSKTKVPGPKNGWTQSVQSKPSLILSAQSNSKVQSTIPKPQSNQLIFTTRLDVDWPVSSPDWTQSGLETGPHARRIARYVRAAVPTALSVFLRMAASGNTSVRNLPRAGVRFVKSMRLLPTIFGNRCCPCLSRSNSFYNFGVDRPAVDVH